MYPKKKPKTDRERFYDAFGKKVGCTPEQYLRRKLAGGMPEGELKRLYDMLAIEIAMKVRCTAIRYDALQLAGASETAAERHVRLRKADFASLHLVSHSLDGQVFDCGARRGLRLPLLGDHQLHNAAVVLAACDTLIEEGWRLSEQNIRDGLADVRWPGRFDILRRDPLFIIDGGHNPQCIDALCTNIRDYLPGQKLVVLTGVLADKDYVDMYKPGLPYVKQFICVAPPNPRRLDAEKLAEYLCGTGVPAAPYETIADGVRAAVEAAGKDGTVLCFGSLYMIGDIKTALDAL